MKKVFHLLIIAGTLVTACRQQPSAAEKDTEAIDTYQNLPGDSALYGLACDGCTDSILILLPFSGGDPDTFDIINAFHEHKIYGRPHIGDELAVILNPEDRQEAQMVVNIGRMRGKWCYQMMPTFRHLDQMPERIQRRMLERIPDSIKQKLMVPREYGYHLRRGFTVQTIGHRQRTNTDEMSPVEYPKVKRYKEWHLYNGRLILSTDSVLQSDGKKGKPETDTADILQLRRDTLVLQFKDHEQQFYRQKESNQ